MKMVLHDRKQVVCVFLLLVAVLTGCSQPDTAQVKSEGPVTLSLSTNRLQVGDILSAELSVEHPVSTSIEFSRPADEDEFTVLNRDWDSDPFSEDTLITTAMYTLQSFSLGDIVLFEDPLLLKSSDGAQSLPVPEIVIHRVSALEMGETSLQDYKSPILWPKSPTYRIFWVLLLVLALSGILALLVLLWIRYTRKPPPPEPVIPPHEKAMAALRDLEARDLIQQAAFEPYYVELSSIVRRYLEDRFTLRAPEQTTEEFIRSLTNSPVLNPSQQDRVKAFMIQSDLVKFAKFQPQPADAQNAMDSATRLVTETREIREETASP